MTSGTGLELLLSFLLCEIMDPEPIDFVGIRLAPNLDFVNRCPFESVT